MGADASKIADASAQVKMVTYIQKMTDLQTATDTERREFYDYAFNPNKVTIKPPDIDDDEPSGDITWSTKYIEGGLPQTAYRNVRDADKYTAAHTNWAWGTAEPRSINVSKEELAFAIKRCRQRKTYKSFDDRGVILVPNIYEVLRTEMNNINAQTYTFASQIGTIVHDTVPWAVASDTKLVKPAARARCRRNPAARKQYQGIKLITQEFATINLARFLSALLHCAIRRNLMLPTSTYSFVGNVLVPGPLTIPFCMWLDKKNEWKPMILIPDLLLSAEGGALIRVIELKTRMAKEPVKGAALRKQLRQSSMQALAVACVCDFNPQIRVEPVLVRAHVPGELNLMGGERPCTSDCTVGPTLTHLNSEAARNILADIILDNMGETSAFGIVGIDDKGEPDIVTNLTTLTDLSTLLRTTTTGRGRIVKPQTAERQNTAEFFKQYEELRPTIGTHFFGL